MKDFWMKDFWIAQRLSEVPAPLRTFGQGEDVMFLLSSGIMQATTEPVKGFFRARDLIRARDLTGCWAKIVNPAQRNPTKALNQ